MSVRQALLTIKQSLQFLLLIIVQTSFCEAVWDGKVNLGYKLQCIKPWTKRQFTSDDILLIIFRIILQIITD